MPIVEWPRRSCTTLGWTPPRSANVAQVWRSPCSVIRCSSHLAIRRTNRPPNVARAGVRCQKYDADPGGENRGIDASKTCRCCFVIATIEAIWSATDDELGRTAAASSVVLLVPITSRPAALTMLTEPRLPTGLLYRTTSTKGFPADGRPRATVAPAAKSNSDRPCRIRVSPTLADIAAITQSNSMVAMITSPNDVAPATNATIAEAAPAKRRTNNDVGMHQVDFLMMR